MLLTAWYRFARYSANSSVFVDPTIYCHALGMFGIAAESVYQRCQDGTYHVQPRSVLEMDDQTDHPHSALDEDDISRINAIEVIAPAESGSIEQKRKQQYLSR
jgi:hypothetical protein